ncbi:MAG: hypothetical protein U0939_17655 [Pirellulales bacterium]
MATWLPKVGGIVAIEFPCAACQKLIRAADGAAGRRGQCPFCGAITQVPTAAPQPYAAPSYTLPAPAGRPYGDAPYGSAWGNPPSTSPYAAPGGIGYGARNADRSMAPAKLMIPAIGILVISVLMIGWGAYSILNLFTSPLPLQFEGKPTEGAVYKIAFCSLTLFSVAINGVAAGGAVQMLRLRGYNAARTGAFVACIPCSVLCLNLVFGIWAVAVLSQPDVKRLFR